VMFGGRSEAPGASYVLRPVIRQRDRDALLRINCWVCQRSCMRSHPSVGLRHATDERNVADATAAERLGPIDQRRPLETHTYETARSVSSVDSLRVLIANEKRSRLELLA
jgi:hypothetical protein